MDFIKEETSEVLNGECGKEFIVADFASGEHDRVPSFFVRIVPDFLEGIEQKKRTTVYSIDLHTLRLDSLLGKLEESAILDRTRVVQAKLESMENEASFRPDLIDFLSRSPVEETWLDRILQTDKKIPQESFDIGVLNTDVVGYLHEYYTEYSDAEVALRQVYRTIKKDGLLIVTNPCSLYVVDNVKVIENVGFAFVEGIDIDLSTGSISEIGRETAPESMSRLNHYSFLVFSKK
jgi:SAM-dependent methyltransferase